MQLTRKKQPKPIPAAPLSLSPNPLGRPLSRSPLLSHYSSQIFIVYIATTCMFRLVLSCKKRNIPKFLPLFQAQGNCLFFSASTCSLQIASETHVEYKREIDFDLLLQRCNTLDRAKCIHALLVLSGRAQNIIFTTRLLNLYAQLGDVWFSRRTFDHIPSKNVYSWNSMVSAYVRCGRSNDALDCFYQFFLTSGLRPDFYTFPPVVKACRYVNDVQKMHCFILKFGFEWDVFVAASLVHVYSLFGIIQDARKLFDNMPVRDRGSWNAMISGYCRNGNAAEALDVADEMRLQGVSMDATTVVSVLSACAQLNDVLTGKLIHLYVTKHGLEFQLFVSNALINMYSKFGSLGNVQKVFNQMTERDIVSWNSIIAAYEQNDDPFKALMHFEKMQQRGIQPDSLTFISLASITAQLNDHQKCKSVHGFVLRKGWLSEVVGNAVVDMYAKMGFMDSARAVFEGLTLKDVISWNSLITGYAQNGYANEAIEVYSTMLESKEITPNQGTWVSIVPAYSLVGALQHGMKIHGRVIKDCICMDVFVSTSLIDMYGKCGNLDDALSLFYEVPRKSSVPWNSIISCHGVHGHGEKAMELFREMRAEGVMPDNVTFVSLLSACSHSGLVGDGQWCFRVMQEEYGIRPTLRHYGCMVDLFGRAGDLDMADKFIQDMPMQPDISVWGALVSACRVHGNVELAKDASKRLFKIDSKNVGYYVLLSNLYANVGNWEAVQEVRSLARDKGLKKTPGWSSIELNNKVDVFYTGGQTHPRSEEIYRELRELTARMKTLGYAPDFSFVLQDVEDDEKEHILMVHSERLAIVYGIISSPPKTPIRIFKNLRVCGDCHNATKLISKITKREITVRDSNRFHHFKDGICSCGDYW